MKRGDAAGPGHGPQGPRQPEARLLVRRLRLRHRSRPAAAGSRHFDRDPADQGREPVDRACAGARQHLAERQGAVGHACATRMASGGRPTTRLAVVRQHADALQPTPRTRSRAAAAARAACAAGVSTIISAPTARRRRAAARSARARRCWRAMAPTSPPPSRRSRRSASRVSSSGAVADAFPGGRDRGRRQPAAISRSRCASTACCGRCNAAELSDGTLRYLLLVAALLSPRPPTLMILNEPETSLHPDLLPPLARLIAKASKECQIIVVSHAVSLVSALQDAGAKRIVPGKAAGRNGRARRGTAGLELAVALGGAGPRAVAWTRTGKVAMNLEALMRRGRRAALVVATIWLPATAALPQEAALTPRPSSARSLLR